MAEFPDHEVPSIGKLQQTTPGWMTAWCCHGACGHRGAFALAVFAILWGPGKSSNELRRRLVCPACGRQGMEIMIPSQTGHPGGGWAAFPAEEMLEIRVAAARAGAKAHVESHDGKA